jgi:choline dehydrogenase
MASNVLIVSAVTNTYVFTANNLSDLATFEMALEKYNDNRTGPLTAPLVSAIAFPPLNVFPPWQEMIANASGRASNKSLPLDTDRAVRLGYAAQRALQIVLLQRSSVGAFEIMSGTNGVLTVANIKPLSRGTVRPASPNIFDSGPLIDPRYCADPYDCRVLLEALRFNDRLIQTAQMQALKPSPAAPFVQPWITAPENETDVMHEVKQRLATEFHPCGTAAMMPRQLGGVVDPQLRVWGTENVRVVDASIFPIIPSAHIQATVYAVAEKVSLLLLTLV